MTDSARARRLALTAGGAVIAAAFYAIAWLQVLPGAPLFMAALAAATLGYLWTALWLGSNPVFSARMWVVCIALAAAMRIPMLTLPEAPARDAVRYVWDARVVRAGLSPYEARPDDASLRQLHSDLTRSVDAGWLPTIYPPAAQLYFVAVAIVDESIAAFRVAALLCDAALATTLALILRRTGRPAAHMLLYAWHPLVPLEGASGAHVDFVGVLALLLSWLALVHGRSMVATLTFIAAVLVKPLPIVLAPLYWRRIRFRDAVVGLAAAGLIAAYITRGGLPLGSIGAFVDTFRFNSPFFAVLERAASARLIAAAAVSIGLLVAAYLRRAHEITEPAAWAWPMTAALIVSPVIYPWYLVWLIPLAIGKLALPVRLWTLTVLAIYPTWHLRRLGGPFVVPPPLVVVEFAFPLMAVLLFVMNRRTRRSRDSFHV